MNKQPRPKYNKLCDMLRELAVKDGLQMSDNEIRKGADRLMSYVELVYKIHKRNEISSE
jgi:hypothetical protein